MYIILEALCDKVKSYRINRAKSERDLEHMKEIQSDHVSLMNKRVRPYFLGALSNQQVQNEHAQAAQDRFAEAKGDVEAWDLRCRAGVRDTFTQEEPTAEDVHLLPEALPCSEGQFPDG